MGEQCPACADSGRPGFIVFARYYDRMIETDVIGERRLTSGVDYMRCFTCRGTGQADAATPPRAGGRDE